MSLFGNLHINSIVRNGINGVSDTVCTSPLLNLWRCQRKKERWKVLRYKPDMKNNDIIVINYITRNLMSYTTIKTELLYSAHRKLCSTPEKPSCTIVWECTMSEFLSFKVNVITHLGMGTIMRYTYCSLVV